MAYTIYTLGDMHVFQASLNALASIFSPSNTGESWLWVSTGNDLGLGYAAYLGMTIALVIFIFNGVLTKRFDLRGLMLPFIVYIILFVPKLEVQIEDVYSGKIAKVGNVPAGIALPASMVSGFMYETTKAFETTFSTVNGNYISMSAEGFVTPLKVLNSLRDGQNQVGVAFPYLTHSLQDFVVDCVNGRATFDESFYAKSSSPISYVLGVGQNVGGLTAYYSSTSPVGEGISCHDAAGKLSADFDKLFSDKITGNGVVNAKGLNAIELFMNAKLGEGRGANGNEPFKYDNYEQSFTKMVQSNATGAKDFVLLTLFTPHVNGAMYCASQYATEADMAKCMPFTAASEQWKENAAAGGTMFSKVMIHGMNIMIFLVYALTPIMAIVLVMMGMQGLKAVGSFALFGISTQMWLPVAAIVNYYIQIQVESTTAALGGDAFLLNIYNAPQFYDQLSTKVAMAGDILGAVPLICMGIFTGSMYATAQIAQRWGGQDNYNEKVNVPDPVQAPALANIGPMLSGARDMAINREGMADPGTFSVTTSNTEGLTRAQSYAQQTGVRFNEALSNAVNQGWQDNTSGSYVQQLGQALRSSGMEAHATILGAQQEIMASHQLSADEKKSASNALRMYADGRIDGNALMEKAGGLFTKMGAKLFGPEGQALEAGLDAAKKVGEKVGGKDKDILSIGAGGGVYHENAADTSATGSNREGSSLAKLLNNSDSFQAQLNREMSASKLDQFGKTYSQIHGASSEDALSRTTEEGRQAADKAERMQASSQGQAVTQTYTGSQFVGALVSNPGLKTMLDQVRDDKINDPEFGVAFQKRMQGLGNTAARTWTTDQQAGFATLMALQDVGDKSTFNRVAGTLMGANQQLGEHPLNALDPTAKVSEAAGVRDRASGLAAPDRSREQVIAAANTGVGAEKRASDWAGARAQVLQDFGVQQKTVAGQKAGWVKMLGSMVQDTKYTDVIAGSEQLEKRMASGPGYMQEVGNELSQMRGNLESRVDSDVANRQGEDQEHRQTFAKGVHSAVGAAYEQINERLRAGGLSASTRRELQEQMRMLEGARFMATETETGRALTTLAQQATSGSTTQAAQWNANTQTVQTGPRVENPNKPSANVATYDQSVAQGMHQVVNAGKTGVQQGENLVDDGMAAGKEAFRQAGDWVTDKVEAGKKLTQDGIEWWNHQW